MSMARLRSLNLINSPTRSVCRRTIPKLPPGKAVMDESLVKKAPVKKGGKKGR